MRQSLATIALIAAYAACAPAEAQERQWLLDAAEQDVYLVFGVPESNDVGVSIWCRIGSQKMSLFTTLPPGIDDQATDLNMAIRSGNTTFALQAMINKTSDIPTVESELLPKDKILEALQGSDSFTLQIGPHKAIYPLIGADFAGLTRLCERAPE